ncbi:hypothetical protein [Streptomyces sp. QHH-9511]|uniref:hypothetical protein n=1 Tax=Streptomyces sp. QHH-9511 TaxID=2684468 RepID=UPI0019C8D981|nr:hypothetical protein GCM10010272_53420 [Streptomyces lateritius]
MTPPVFDSQPLAVRICGDDEAALTLVYELVRDVGCEPLAGGGLERAGLLGATAALFPGLWVEQADVRAIAPPVATKYPKWGVRSFEANELIEELLGRPVLRKPDRVALDLVAQVVGRGGPSAERVVVQVPQSAAVVRAT